MENSSQKFSMTKGGKFYKIQNTINISVNNCGIESTKNRPYYI